MKILYHHRTLGDGAEGIHVTSIVEALRGLTHDVRVAAIIGEQTNVTNWRTRLLTPFTRVMPRPVYELIELAYSAAAYRVVSRHIAEWRPDFLYERYTLFNLGGVAAARAAGIPIVMEVNAPLAWERAHYERLSLRRMAERCEQWVGSHADVVIAVSTPLKDDLVRRGVPAHRIVVLPNGADPTRFRPDPGARADVRARHGIDPAAVVVGFTGILRPWHGVDILICAVAAARAAGAPIHALIVGDGPSLASLQRIARELNLKQAITFTGRVPHTSIPQYIASFDIGVSPRATFYASPMKIPEYMASGAAVIAPRMPNIADLITESVDGELYAPDDVNDLTRLLRRLASDHAHRRKLGAAARNTIINGRTWRHNAERIVELGLPAELCA